MIRSYWIETYGCQMNTAESNALELQLKGAGLVPAKSAEDADCAILNTCSVRKSAENRIWGRLGLFAHIKTLHPLTLIVTGCMAERLQEDLKDDAPHVDYVLGTNDKQKILEVLISPESAELRSETYSFGDSYYNEGEYSSYIPIMNGCNNFCSYCIVPYVRGREISRPVEEVLDEVRYLDSKGVKEITLLGQNVNSYHYENDGKVITFPSLLERVCSVAGEIEWIRFESPHPKDFSDSLIRVIKEQPKVAKHLHIPMQSGNTRILGLMNRKYTRDRFLSLIETIKREIPEATFATDVMVGFPSETEEEYQDTLTALDEMGCIEAFMYYFNPREGTAAVTFPGEVPEEERGRRLTQLIHFQHKIFVREKSERAEGIAKVVVSAVSRNDKDQMLGRTEHNEMVVFDGSSEVGSIVTVRLTGLKGNTYTGSLIV
ncbi:MAG TPA: tRNA (N6-isopentenyl adenosine(37)-C2)-methylthiotransferase MiaB [Sphaerochaeta sp.]|nr:tRNA (N6-isopentenyl adenosine(37)-C2)-methylthiotransferase MiaB [Spirochaetales bacterium]HKM07369.1 tRNA (N6-isopentenyl adenosine(37)-C2)-methylthiotransferase MiaB [Sphaerochaeta sp.]